MLWAGGSCKVGSFTGAHLSPTSVDPLQRQNLTLRGMRGLRRQMILFLVRGWVRATLAEATSDAAFLGIQGKAGACEFEGSSSFAAKHSPLVCNTCAASLNNGTAWHNILAIMLVAMQHFVTSSAAHFAVAENGVNSHWRYTVVTQLNGEMRAQTVLYQNRDFLHRHKSKLCQTVRSALITHQK